MPTSLVRVLPTSLAAVVHAAAGAAVHVLLVEMLVAHASRVGALQVGVVQGAVVQGAGVHLAVECLHHPSCPYVHHQPLQIVVVDCQPAGCVRMWGWAGWAG